jgi:hypothetical protein
MTLCSPRGSPKHGPGTVWVSAIPLQSLSGCLQSPLWVSAIPRAIPLPKTHPALSGCLQSLGVCNPCVSAILQSLSSAILESEPVCAGSQSSDRLWQSDLLQRSEKLVDRHRWILQSQPLRSRRRAEVVDCGVQEFAKRRIGLTRRHAVRCQGLERKVQEVEGDNQPGLCMDSGCEYMPVAWVWQGQ